VTTHSRSSHVTGATPSPVEKFLPCSASVPRSWAAPCTPLYKPGKRRWNVSCQRDTNQFINRRAFDPAHEELDGGQVCFGRRSSVSGSGSQSQSQSLSAFADPHNRLRLRLRPRSRYRRIECSPLLLMPRNVNLLMKSFIRSGTEQNCHDSDTLGVRTCSILGGLGVSRLSLLWPGRGSNGKRDPGPLHRGAGVRATLPDSGSWCGTLPP